MANKQQLELWAAAEYGKGYDLGLSGEIRERNRSTVYVAGFIAGQKEKKARVRRQKEQLKGIKKRLKQR